MEEEHMDTAAEFATIHSGFRELLKDLDALKVLTALLSGALDRHLEEATSLMSEATTPPSPEKAPVLLENPQKLRALADAETDLGDQFLLAATALDRAQARLVREIREIDEGPAERAEELAGAEEKDEHLRELARRRETVTAARTTCLSMARLLEQKATEIECEAQAAPGGVGQGGAIPPATPRGVFPQDQEMSAEDFIEKAKSEVRHAVDYKDDYFADPHLKKAKRQAEKATAMSEAQQRIPKLTSFDDAASVASIAAAESQISIAQSVQQMASSTKGTSEDPLRIQMKRAAVDVTPDTPLWFRIRQATRDIGWDNYCDFMRSVLCVGAEDPDVDTVGRDAVIKDNRLRLPFPDVDAYRFLKIATEVFMQTYCGVSWSPRPLRADLDYGERRLGQRFQPFQIARLWRQYAAMSTDGFRMLPYLALIRQKLGDVATVEWSQGKDFTKALAACSGLLREKLQRPCLLELIWSYWHEEGMLVQTMNAISRRFQNVRTPGERDPLVNLEIDPLRPLNNFLWGYIQDEQHRLTVVRRANEYDHHYGLRLVGKAVPGIQGADSRTRFLEAFHNLLHVCTLFYMQDDDTTVIADGFPVLNALRDVHVILSQGAHNQYGDLPWTARQEMLMQQWLLARPEMREFLPTRIMVAYPEPWMDRVEAVKSLMGWTDTSVLHFRELGIYGEGILLGARFNDWTRVTEPERAANWARFWRPEVQGYVHAYRAVAGIDLTERADATMPSTLLRQRLGTQRVAAR
jgi:hypothetical protein